MDDADIEAARRAYAAEILRVAEVADSRIGDAFAAVPREAFLPPPPWTVIRMGVGMRTSDVASLYDNVLVAIAPERGINNGEPALHVAWIDAVSPQPGETVIHVGAGTGYYTAILARLVEPGGRVEAFEYESDLAAQAVANLQDRANVTVHAASAFGRTLPSGDIVYVNAGVVAPDVEWLRALNPGGRLIFPWQPHKGWGPAMLVTRRGQWLQRASADDRRVHLVQRRDRKSLGKKPADRGGSRGGAVDLDPARPLSRCERARRLRRCLVLVGRGGLNQNNGRGEPGHRVVHTSSLR